MMSNPLGYETHFDLKINHKEADECENLGEIRYEIDTIDHLIVKLMSRRIDYALATLRFKSEGKPIPDNQRIIQALQQRKSWAQQYHLDQDFIEQLFKQMIDWYMKQQIQFYQKQNPHETNLQIKFKSLSQLKSMEYHLDWIHIDHFDRLLSSAYQKFNETNQPVLLSFTQSVPQQNSFDFNDLFESNRSEDVLLLKDPSILSFGNLIEFNCDNVIKQWSNLLLNSIIDSNCHGPMLFGYLSSNANRSFVLPQIQFIQNQQTIFMTLNAIIDQQQQQQQHSISILNLIYKLFQNNRNQNVNYSDSFFGFSKEKLNYSRANSIECSSFNVDSIGELESFLLRNENKDKWIVGLIDSKLNSLFRI